MQDSRNGYIWYPTFKRAGALDADALLETLPGMFRVSRSEFQGVKESFGIYKAGFGGAAVKCWSSDIAFAPLRLPVFCLRNF